MKIDLVIENASEIATASSSLPHKGKNAGDILTLKNGFLAIAQGKIIAIGTRQCLSGLDLTDAQAIDASGKTVTPGFVDCHTHLVYAGSREDELELKAKGVSYLEILSQGGGILKTVRQTRAATSSQLVTNAKKTLDKMLANGTTTIEAKSGYGLNLENEVKILEAAHAAIKTHPIQAVHTFLGAHAIPSEKTSSEYTAEVIEMLPFVKNLAEYCDVFCEKDIFSTGESRKILEAAIGLGFKTRLHADELSNTNGAELAASLNASSADHLLFASPNGIKQMAAANVTAVLLPGTSFSSMLPYANARAFIESNVAIALATDHNPNCLTESMPFVIALACRYLKLSPAEALIASTINAAHSIGKASEIGSLEIGKQADLAIIDAPNHKFLAYHFGVSMVDTVVKKGKTVFSQK